MKKTLLAPALIATALGVSTMDTKASMKAEEMDLEVTIRNKVPSKHLLKVKEISITKGNIIEIEPKDQEYLMDSKFHIKIHYNYIDKKLGISLYDFHNQGNDIDYVTLGNESDYVKIFFHPIQYGWNFEIKSFGKLKCESTPSVSTTKHQLFMYMNEM